MPPLPHDVLRSLPLNLMLEGLGLLRKLLTLLLMPLVHLRVGSLPVPDGAGRFPRQLFYHRSVAKLSLNNETRVHPNRRIDGRGVNDSDVVHRVLRVKLKVLSHWPRWPVAACINRHCIRVSHR